MALANIAVSTDGNVSAGTVLWRYKGRLHLTVVVKALFTIVPDGAAVLAGPGDIATEDRTFDANPSRSVEVATDLVPYRPRCDVTFVGHAHAPRGQPAPAGSVRLGLSRDGRPLLDKVLHVFGDRAPSGAPVPFDRMPIVYERALGGAGEPNPVGAEAPNIVDPKDPRSAGGYGPISRFWPARKRLLGKIDRRALDAKVAALPDEMPWPYYQSAPPDQQTDPLTGGEWLVLDGVHPSLARVQTRLPTAPPAARVALRSPLAPAADSPVDLLCDTLAIDGDGLSLSIVWRGRLDLGATDPEGLVIVAAALGPSPDWPSLFAKALPASHTASAASPAAGEETHLLSGPPPSALSRPSAPFPIAAPRPSAPESAPVPGLPWSSTPLPTAPVARSLSVGEETVPVTSAPSPATALHATAPHATSPVATPSLPAAPPHPLAERLRKTGASADEIAALLSALIPPT